MGRPAQLNQLRAHQSYLTELSTRGTLLFAGSFDESGGGMIVVRAASIHEATAIAQGDPLIAAGLERCQIRRLSSVIDPNNRLGPSEDDVTLIQPVPVVATKDSFSVADALTDERFASFAVQCFAKSQLSVDDPHRQEFIQAARERGLQKLVLLLDDQVVGQLELAPAATSGLPIAGEGVTVMHCMWVPAAFGSLGVGQRLCREAMERADRGLATIAFDSDHGWLPRSFYERLGFRQVAETHTGRFFGETPINAYLMWKAKGSGSDLVPRWDAAQLVDGVSFCPAYPWLFGSQRYWGRRFAYHVRVVRQGLTRPAVLEQFAHLAQREIDHWTVVELGLPAADLRPAIERIQQALSDAPTYYATVKHIEGDELFVVFPHRVFDVKQDAATWDAAIRYGLSCGIPRRELVFSHPPL